MPREINYMTFDRDTLDNVAVVWPKGHDKFPEGKQMTQRQVIEEDIARFGNFHGRKDLAMINILEDNQVVEQIVIEPSRSGEPNLPDYAALMLTNAERRALKKANRRLIEIEKANGWPDGTLSGY